MLSPALMYVDHVPVTSAVFGEGEGDILLDNVVCQGDESSLLECRSNRIGEHNCDHSEDAGVRCEGRMHKVLFALKYVTVTDYPCSNVH